MKFGSIWILHPKVSKFGGVKSKHYQILGDKIQILKRYGVKFKHIQTLGSKFQILKLQCVKFKYF